MMAAGRVSLAQMPDFDEAVKATNDDAALCKQSAIQLGYWKDRFLQYFVKPADRKAPEINRGYYARVQAIKHLVDQAIRITDGKCQIVNLGAGFDTLYWRLKEDGKQITNFVELDFPSVTSRKCYYIKRTKSLLENITTEDGEVKFSSCDLHAPNYHLVGVDLRELSELKGKMKEAEMDFALPTIFIAECVLVYMEESHSQNLLQWITSNFRSSIFINYEQVNMADRFGQVMVDNLNKRGCSLLGIVSCKSLESQKERYLAAGWDSAEAWDMIAVYAFLPQAEIQRIEKLEFLDERELIEQLFQHYCISIAYFGNGAVRLSEVKF